LPDIPADPTQDTAITYRANTDTAQVVYFDDTTKTWLATDQLTGKTATQSDYDPAAKIAAFEAQGYTLVSDNYPTTGITFSAENQIYSVHLKHNLAAVTTDLNKVVTETIHYQYADGTVAANEVTDQVTFTRTGVTDQVTGITTYTPWQATDNDTTFAAVKSPNITGYVADKATVAEVANITADTQNRNVTVSYTQMGAYQITPPNGGKTTTITYPNDPDNPTDAGTPTTETGVVPNEPGYTPVGPDGQDLTPVDPDDPNQGYKLPHVPSDPTQDTTITYRANTDTAQVVYFDDTTKTWLATDQLTGKTATQSDYDPAAKITAFEAQGYTLVSDNYPTTGLTFSAEKQVYAIHLKHVLTAATTNLSQTVTETIHYQYANSATQAAKDHTDRVTFTRTGTTDQVTGETTYTQWQAVKGDTVFDQQPSPVIDGYVASNAMIAAVTDITAATANIEVTVTYTKLGAYQITPPNGGQTTTITYPNDPDNPDQAGTPTTTTGVVPNEPGYTPVGPDGKDLTPVDPDDPSKGYELPHVPSDPTQDTTITYVANDQTITTNYVDEKGQTIAPSTSQTVKTDERYSTTPAVINGYILDDTKLPSNASGTANGVITVTYVYKQLGSYQITPPNDGQEIDITYPNEPTNPDKTGDNTKVVPNEPGYTPVGPDGKALTPVDPDDPSKGYELPHVPGDPTQNTTITYVANDVTVTTDFVDERGQTVAPSTSQKTKTGEKYNTTPAVVSGYILTGIPANASGTANGSITVTYVYKKLGSYQITPPNNGQEIDITYPNDPEDPDKTGNNTEVVPNEPGYTPVGPDGKTPLTPVDPNDPSKGYELPHVPDDPTQNTTITYVANDQMITTNYVDEKGQTVAPSTSQTVKTGEKYSTTPTVVSGYILDGTKLPTNANGTAISAVTVTYVYKQLGSYQITPPNDGQEIDITYPNDPTDPDKTGSSTKVVPNEPGYTPVGPDGKDLTPVDPDEPSKGYELPHVPDDPTQNTTITYVANNITITTDFVDKNGKPIAPSTNQSVKAGTRYSTIPAVINGYILTGMPANASGTANGSITVTYVYKKLGSYQITPPNNGQEIDITYPNDPEDPNKTGNNTKVVPNEPGYTPVGPDGKNLTPVDPGDPSKGYELPHVPSDPSQSIKITYRQITPKTPSQSGTTTTVPGQPADTATVPITSGATTPVTAPITGRSASTPSSETVAAKGQQPAGAPATTKQAVEQKALPQTSEQTSSESSVLGLGLLTATLSWFGLKRKRHEK
jgi:LPXTG-motif cell wall-anchored protein